MTEVVYAYPEVQPTELRQDVDYSFYFVLMGMEKFYCTLLPS